jgi:DNA-binding PadR family transcriptional regulator
MAPSRKGDLSASVAILGLVIQRSDTINGVRSRLVERFPGAGWSRSIAYGAMTSLAERGYVRVAVGAAERSLDLYEATPEGVGWFRQWLGEFSAAPPVLRDALRAKLQYVSDERDLRAVIEAIREQEEACLDAGDAAKIRLNKARRRGLLGPAKGAGWESRLRSALMTDEVLLWRDMATRLQRFRVDLEGDDEQLEGLHGDGGDDR